MRFAPWTPPLTTTSTNLVELAVSRSPYAGQISHRIIWVDDLGRKLNLHDTMVSRTIEAYLIISPHLLRFRRGTFHRNNSGSLLSS